MSNQERPKKRTKTAGHRESHPTTTRSEPQPPKMKLKPESRVKEKIKHKNKGKAREEDVRLPSSFKIIAGSYEKLLYGLDGTVTVDDQCNLQFHLTPTFIFPAHVSCIKAVAASPNGGKWLATGSADEIIKVWDLRRKKEIGGLMQHEGSITHLTFPSRSHLLSASEDGTLCLFRARDWAVLRVLKGHKGRINSVAVHPSGKVALSVGKDRALRMWDLMRGKGVASTKIGKEGEIVRWSADGSKFAVQSGSTIDIYSTTMDIVASIKHPSRLHDIKFIKMSDSKGELLLAAAEDRKVSAYHLPDDASSPTIIAQLVGHSNRVKALQTLELALPPKAKRKTTTIVCTVSSDGNVQVYDLFNLSDISLEEAPEPAILEPVTTYDSKGTRLTCVTVADGDIDEPSVLGQKRKHETADDDDESEEEEWEFGKYVDDDDANGGYDKEEQEEEGQAGEAEEESD